MAILADGEPPEPGASLLTEKPWWEHLGPALGDHFPRRTAVQAADDELRRRRFLTSTPGQAVRHFACAANMRREQP